MANTVQKLWEDFDALYSIVTCREPSEEDIASYFLKSKSWVTSFTSLGDKRIEYKRVNVTPYMHAMVYHIPTFLQNYKTIKLFTGQGVGKTMIWQGL